MAYIHLQLQWTPHPRIEAMCMASNLLKWFHDPKLMEQEWAKKELLCLLPNIATFLVGCLGL